MNTSGVEGLLAGHRSGESRASLERWLQNRKNSAHGQGAE